MHFQFNLPVQTCSSFQQNYSATDKHHKRSTSHRKDLMLKLRRLQNNTLQTVTKTFLAFVCNKKGLSIFSFNCQSLHMHAPDRNNKIIVKKSNILLLTATHMKNEKSVDIPNFNFVLNYKRPEVSAAVVAIYHNTGDTSHNVISYMDIHTNFIRGIGVNVFDIGEICVARSSFEIWTVLGQAVKPLPENDLKNCDNNDERRVHEWMKDE
ncbi:hypothetical protein M0802_015027 [Mischocyttarus mexicanus]|nr:hypothetical protein M0802_015027 [Mischocyttarus mexicanus]